MAHLSQVSAMLRPASKRSQSTHFSIAELAFDCGVFEPIVALVSGDGACFQAVASHLKSLAD